MKKSHSKLFKKELVCMCKRLVCWIRIGGNFSVLGWEEIVWNTLKGSGIEKRGVEIVSYSLPSSFLRKIFIFLGHSFFLWSLADSNLLLKNSLIEFLHWGLFPQRSLNLRSTSSFHQFLLIFQLSCFIKLLLCLFPLLFSFMIYMNIIFKFFKLFLTEI